jgi:hypothetical protein
MSDSPWLVPLIVAAWLVAGTLGYVGAYLTDLRRRRPPPLPPLDPWGALAKRHEQEREVVERLGYDAALLTQLHNDERRALEEHERLYVERLDQ